MPRTDLNDQRSDKNKLVVSAAVEAKMPFAAAAAMAWPEYKAGETMTLSELAATSGDDIALPVGEWVCLGLCLSTTSGVGDNDRTHYLALKLVRVGPDAFTVCVCDGIGTDGILRELEAARVWGGRQLASMWHLACMSTANCSLLISPVSAVPTSCSP